MDMKPSGGKINKAAAEMPRSGHDRPAGGQSKPVGETSRADMKGAQMGQPTDKNPLRGAMKELASQHPHSYDQLGPHHGGSEHVRHIPLHGMKSGG